MTAHTKKLDEKENRAIEKFKSNPKFFYSYARSLSTIKSSIKFDANQEITTDTKQMADLLQEQFSSMFSDPSSPDIKDPDFPLPIIEHPQTLEDFCIKDDDIISAIGNIPSNSASGPDEYLLSS